MTLHPTPGEPVRFEWLGRHLEGVVEDVRWSPTWTDAEPEIVVDADGTRITTGRAAIQPR